MFNVHLQRMYILFLSDEMLYISIMAIWSNVLFKAYVYLWIFSLNYLSIDISGVLKSPTIVVLLPVSHLMSVNICLIYWGAPVLEVYIFTIFLSSHIDPSIIM